MREPVGAAAVEALVQGLPDEVLQRGNAFPHDTLTMMRGSENGRVSVALPLSSVYRQTKPGLRSAKPLTSARLLVKSAMCGSSRSYLMRPIFSSAR
jgi:hypothetical protein